MGRDRSRSLSGRSTLLDSSPENARRARSLLTAILCLAALAVGCQRVGTSRARFPWAHSAGAKPGREAVRADLHARGLGLEFALHPREVFRELEAETRAQPTPRGFLILGE